MRECIYKYRGEVPNMSLLQHLPEVEEGDVIKCLDTNKMYAWRNGEWNEFQDNTLKMNLYDLNKNIISQLKPLTPAELNKKISLIEDFHNKRTDSHFMLLCRDCGYYTVFENEIGLMFPTFASAVLDILNGLGQVMSLEETEDKGAIEVWIRQSEESSPMVYYLFPYDAGVVYYG